MEITLLTRIGELLENHPQLEEVLVRYAPAFKKLRNPILRRTVARVTTVQKAASVAGIDARELLSALRRAAGQADTPAGIGSDPGTEQRQWSAPPARLNDAAPSAEFDADALLNAGEVPLSRVGQAARQLPHDGFIRVRSTFRPEPLLEALEKQGFRLHLREVADGRFETIVLRRRQA